MARSARLRNAAIIESATCCRRLSAAPLRTPAGHSLPGAAKTFTIVGFPRAVARVVPAREEGTLPW
jgi:hypothetical protein